jgi:uncharacterized protein (TIGR02231 family)
MKRLVSAVALVFMISFSATAAEIPVDSAIVSVVVYPDRALVTRSAQVSLEEGEHVIRFMNLPPSIDLESLQVRGQGEAGVRLLSTEARKVALEHPRAEEIARLEAEIQEVRDQIAATGAHLEDLKAEDKLVHDIGVYTGEQFSKEFITCEPQPGEWAAMVEFQRTNLARLSEETLQTNIYKRELNTRLDALVRQLEELHGQAARESLNVEVNLSAYRPGAFEVLLSAVIFGATWQPSYEARADAPNEQVLFTAIGNVRQHTGEDWQNVSLSLSSARPAIGAEMPEIDPWVLQPRPPLFKAEAFDQDLALEREAPMAAAPAEVVEARIIALETSVQFQIPYKLDIPSDNAYHRATIFTENLKADFSYTSTPKLSPFAYLIGKTVNTTGAYWLPGKTTVFAGGDMIGSVYIGPVAPNEELTLSFGIDEGVSVEREELVRKEDESRIFGSRKERLFKDKITGANHKAKPIKLRVIDQVPVSRHEDIKITDVDFSVKPTERDPDTGIVKWDLTLPPNEKKEIIIQFTVAHPLDMDIIGL